MTFAETIKTHKPTTVKLVLILLALVFIGLTATSYASSQSIKAQQQKNSQAAVAGHTQTLIQIKATDTEIKNAVDQIKASNTTDHQQTVQYINCVLVGITGASTNAEIQMVYENCLKTSGAT